MTSERRIEALKELGTPTPPPEDADDAVARRKRVVASVASTIRRESTAREARRKRTRIVAVLSAAAVVAIAAGTAWRLGASSHPIVVTTLTPQARLAGATGAVVKSHAGHAEAVASDVPLAADDEVTTAPDAHVRMMLESGAIVEIAQGSRVRLEPAPSRNEQVGITVGEIVVHVPKLGAGESFRVATPDSEVLVHGTSFIVTVRDGATHVSVTEGVVSVKNSGTETFLHPGESWPAASPPPSASVTPPEPDTPPSASAPRLATSKPESSSLAEQNRLLQRALDARRRGDDLHALESLDQLLGRYPSSPLAQEARVEKFRALERRGDHVRATNEARRYLADYPNGFAATEAKALVVR